MICTAKNCGQRRSTRYAPTPYCDDCHEYVVLRSPDPPPLHARIAAWARRLWRERNHGGVA